MGLPLIALGVGLAGTALSAGSQYVAGRTRRKAYEYNAKVSEANALASRQKAAREEEIQRGKLGRIVGTQKAAFGAAGVAMEGTPLSIIADTIYQGEKEAEYIKYGGEMESARYLNEARMNRYYGKMAGRMGTIEAGSTFFTGLGRAGLGYLGMKNKEYKTKNPWGPTGYLTEF